MKRLLLAIAALISTPAFGQAWDHSDWLDGSVPVRDWSVDSTLPTGAAPADAYEPEDEADPIDDTPWIITTDGSSDYLTDPIAAGRDLERKFRILCGAGAAKYLDPILFPGVAPPIGHRHEGIGNAAWSQNSTWTSLRASPSSSCSGGPLNGTIYWEPELLQDLPSGVTAGRKPSAATFYYVNGIIGQSQNLTWLRRNFRFIGGMDPNNFNDTARRAEYTAGGLEYPGSPSHSAGWGGWQCFAHDNLGGNAVTVTRTESMLQNRTGGNQSGYARHLKAADGSDPWGGNCTGSVASPGKLILNLTAADCWDGHNLGSPNGREHVAYMARSGDNVRTDVCPRVTVNGVVQQYRKVPKLQAKTEFWHSGPSDYTNLYFGSDRMNAPETAADPTSFDECRRAGPYFCNGATAHFDWWNGWDSAVADEWQRECLGITVRGVAPTNGPAECNTSQTSKFRKMKYTGASPDPDMSAGCANIGASCWDPVPSKPLEMYNPIPAGTPVTGVLHSHGEE